MTRLTYDTKSNLFVSSSKLGHCLGMAQQHQRHQHLLILDVVFSLLFTTALRTHSVHTKHPSPSVGPSIKPNQYY